MASRGAKLLIIDTDPGVGMLSTPQGNVVPWSALLIVECAQLKTCQRVGGRCWGRCIGRVFVSVGLQPR